MEMTTPQATLSAIIGTRPVLPILLEDPSAPRKRVPGNDLDSHECSVVRRVLIGQWAPTVQTGLQIYQSELTSQRFFTTSSDSLTNLMEGGFLSGELTELCGLHSCGKTWLCHEVCATSLLHPNATCLYIDTQASFSPSSLLQMAQLSNPEMKKSNLERVRVAFCPQVNDLLDVLYSTRKSVLSCKTNSDDFFTHLQLIIVDSLSAPFTPLYGTNNIETNGIQRVACSQLSRLALECRCAVLVSTHGLQGSFQNRPHTRILLTMHPISKERKARVLHSGRLKPQTEAVL